MACSENREPVIVPRHDDRDGPDDGKRGGGDRCGRADRDADDREEQRQERVEEEVLGVAAPLDERERDEVRRGGQRERRNADWHHVGAGRADQRHRPAERDRQHADRLHDLERDHLAPDHQRADREAPEVGRQHQQLHRERDAAWRR